MSMSKEVQKLMEVRFIQEIKYLTWMTNIVIMKKSSGNYEYMWVSHISTRHMP